MAGFTEQAIGLSALAALGLTALRQLVKGSTTLKIVDNACELALKQEREKRQELEVRVASNEQKIVYLNEIVLDLRRRLTAQEETIS